MAEPNDSAFVLLDEANLYMTQYRKGLDPQFMFLDNNTRMFWKPQSVLLGAKDYEVSLLHQPQRSARMESDLLAVPHTPGSYKADTYTISIDETAGNNHLRRCMNSVRVTYVDIVRASQSREAKADLLQKLVSGSREDVNMHLATHTHLDTNATLGTINGAPKDEDGNLYADCTSYSNGSTTCRVVVTGPIARFTPGMRVDLYDSGGSGRYTNNGATTIITVEDVKVEDNSISLKKAGSSPGNFDNLVSTDTIHASGEYGKHWTSLGEWFGTANIFGKDRTATSARYLVPSLFRSGSSTATFEPSFLDDAANKMFRVRGSALRSTPYRAWMSPDIAQDFRDSFDETAISVRNVGPSGVRALADIGYTGGVYRHPLLGDIAIDADPLAEEGKIRFTALGEWGTLWAGNRTFTWIPGTQNGIWYRIQDGNAGGGTMFYQADGFLMGVDFCTFPRGQFEIQNLSD